jgi:uncharacterized protein (TIGR02145 family)
MAKVYKFQSQDRTIDVDIHTNAFGDIKHFQITDIVGLSPAEVRWGFDLTRDVYYEHEFIAYAKEKSLNLYLWDDETFEGKLNDAIILYTVTISKTGNGTITPDVGEHIYQEGTEVPISIVESDEDYYHESTTVDAVPVTVPYDLVVSGNHIIEHLFLPWQKILDVFSTAPVLKNNKWVFADSTPYENDLEVDGNCLITNGITDFDYIPNDSDIIIGTGDFTMSCRCILISGYGVIFQSRQSGKTNYIQLLTADGSISAGFAAGDGYLSVYESLNYDELHSFTIARTENKWDFWIDSIMVNSNNLSSINFDSAVGISIGAAKESSTTGGSYLNAKFESFCFEKRCWTNNEIIEYHTNGTMPNTCLIKKIYNNKSGLYCPDLSGNNKNGSIKGTWGISKLIKPNLQISNYSSYKYDIRKYYNQYAVDTGKLAPLGSHVPTEAEIITLYTYLGGAATCGDALKRSGTYSWLTGNTGTNTAGLSINGSGIFNSTGFNLFKTDGYFWLSTTSKNVKFTYNSSALTIVGSRPKYQGIPIRLILDSSTDPGSITDYDGNVYQTVKIGNQVWITSDFKCTHYNDGTVIPFYTDATTFVALTSAGCINYNNELENDLFFINDLQNGSKFDCWGFTKINDYLAGGFQKNPGNTITVSGLNSDVLPDGDYTWQQIYDLVQSAQLVKTQDANKISQMVIKKKIVGSNEVSVLTENTILTENSIFI